jgi:hypothetical protein
VRHFLILAALTLGACAGPVAFNVGSMHMHPSQEFCVSRGLTLDATTKECVTAATSPQSPPATPPPHVAQVQPSPSPPPPAGPVQPPPQERQRAVSSVPIESDAVIDPRLKQDSDQMDELAHFVRASGYRCESISALRPMPPSHGYKLVCNRFAYRYEVEDKDGRWIVTVN